MASLTNAKGIFNPVILFENKNEKTFAKKEFAFYVCPRSQGTPVPAKSKQIRTKHEKLFTRAEGSMLHFSCT